jgi:hypothetical protein
LSPRHIGVFSIQKLAAIIDSDAAEGPGRAARDLRQSQEFFLSERCERRIACMPVVARRKRLLAISFLSAESSFYACTRLIEKGCSISIVMLACLVIITSTRKLTSLRFVRGLVAFLRNKTESGTP